MKSDRPTLRPHLHPATSLALWALALILAMSAALHVAVNAAICVSLLALCLAPRQYALLLRRSRWLLLSTVLVLTLMTPGISLLDWSTFLAPTREGLWSALDQASRLVLALAMLSILLSRISEGELVAGMRCLALTLGIPSQTADKLALRLTLTLQALQRKSDTGPSLPWSDWLQGNSNFAGQSQRFVPESKNSATEPVVIPDYPMNRTDRVLVWFCLIGGMTISVLMFADKGMVGS